MTAAAFAKGMLELDGDLVPILASLVKHSAKNDMLLDDESNAKKQLAAVKDRLKVR